MFIDNKSRQTSFDFDTTDQSTEENLVIYASKKSWFWENRPYGVRPYVRPPLQSTVPKKMATGTFTHRS